MLKRKRLNILLIAVAILLAVGIGVVYIVGENRIKNQQNKKITGATEVNSFNGGSEKEKQNTSGTTSNENISADKGKAEETKIESVVKKDKFSGLTLKNNDKGIPVLMYHSVDKEILPNGQLNELRVPKETFREQMKYLKDNGFTTLTLDEAYKFLQNNEGVPEKSVLITFDDGYEDNYTNAYPILKEFGLNATIFVITAYIDKDTYYMSSSQLKELEANGIEIQSHTVNHDRLNELSYDKQLITLRDSKAVLEKLLNKKIDYIAYPFGLFNDNTVKAAKEAGYTMAFTTNGKWSDKEDGLFTLDRVYISSLRDFENFKERVNNPNFK